MNTSGNLSILRMMMMMMMNMFLCYVVFKNDFIYMWHPFSWFCDSICVSYEPPTEADPIWNNFPWPRWHLKALYHPSTLISGTEDHPECQLSIISCEGSGWVSCSRTVWRANFSVGKCTTDPHMGSCHWPPHWHQPYKDSQAVFFLVLASSKVTRERHF